MLRRSGSPGLVLRLARLYGAGDGPLMRIFAQGAS
jgi:hypothetical protein